MCQRCRLDACPGRNGDLTTCTSLVGGLSARDECRALMSTLYGVSEAPQARAAALEAKEALMAQVALTPQVADDADEPVDQPYYWKEWRGAPAFQCPAPDHATFRTSREVAIHIERAHPVPRTQTAAERARAAGIIIPPR